MDRMKCEAYIMSAIDEYELENAGMKQLRRTESFLKINDYCNSIDKLIRNFNAIRYDAYVDQSACLSIVIELEGVQFSVGTIGSDEWDIFSLLIESEHTSVSVSEGGNLLVEFEVGCIWEVA